MTIFLAAMLKSLHLSVGLCSDVNKIQSITLLITIKAKSYRSWCTVQEGTVFRSRYSQNHYIKTKVRLGYDYIFTPTKEDTDTYRPAQS